VIDALGNPQSVLVLGGTSDIAKATLQRLDATRLERVVLAGRDAKALEQVASSIARDGRTVAVESFDADQPGSHDAWVADVFDRHGGFDVVLLAFGVLGEQAAAEADTTEALRVSRANYLGAVSVALPTVRRMMLDGHGVFVVLSSVAGDRARRSNFVYGASKAGLDAFAQGLTEMARGVVRVVIVRPGFVKTKMTEGMKPVPFSTTADVVADAIVGAIRTGKEVVYVPGVLRFVMLVLRNMPRAVFRRLPL
jgi:decaprenylphospho-beta-D-erythro-pentofuranosid-2-ulose 2-reductase